MTAPPLTYEFIIGRQTVEIYTLRAELEQARARIAELTPAAEPSGGDLPCPANSG